MNMNTNSCKTDIINRALSILKEQGIVDSNIEPNTDTEKLVNLWFDTALKECIIDVTPPFAIKREVLLKEKDVDAITLNEYNLLENSERDSDIVNTNILHAYKVPSDCLVILQNKKYSNNSINDNYIVEGNYIYSSIDNKYNLRYLCSTKELYEREAKFNLCLSYYLAYYICADLTNSDQKIQLFLNLKNKKMSETRTYYQKQIGVHFIKNYRWKKW